MAITITTLKTTHCSPSTSAAPLSSSLARIAASTTSHRHRQKPLPLRCASFSNNKCESAISRRSITIAFVVSQWISIPKYAVAGSIFDKYVKRKKLEPLEVYVPALLLTQLQFKDLEKTLEANQPEYSICRSLLRAGPAASLRVNIRASLWVLPTKKSVTLGIHHYLGARALKVAQYASDDGNGKAAFENVDQCLRALEDLDSLFLHALRNDPDASVKSMKSKIAAAMNALDSVLNTVPSAILDKGKEIAEAYGIPNEAETETVDPELKQLESLL